MKLELGKTYVTRDGNPVRIICTDRAYEYYPVVGLVKNNGSEILVTYTADGEYNYCAITNSSYDIVNEYNPWINIPVDAKVIVTGGSATDRWLRHFARYDEDTDQVLVYHNGRTSYTKLDNYPYDVYPASSCTLVK